MNNYCNIPSEETTQDLRTYAHKYCLTKVDCSPSCELILKPCSEIWENQLCQADEKFCIPYAAGDKIQFQTRFPDEYNPDPENPVDGWGDMITLELHDENGAFVPGDHTNWASCYLVGWACGFSYQIVEIDTSLLPVTNWTVEIFTNHPMSGEPLEYYCSEPFREVLDCEELVKIRSKYPKLDCCGNYYGSPEAYAGNKNFMFNNQLSYIAALEEKPLSMQKTVFDCKPTELEIRKRFDLTLGTPIPPYLSEYLLSIHMGGEIIYIDDVEYFIDSVSPEDVTVISNMHLFSIELYQKCEKNFNC